MLIPQALSRLSSLQPTVSSLSSLQHYTQQLKYEVNQCVLNLNVKYSHTLVFGNMVNSWVLF